MAAVGLEHDDAISDPMQSSEDRRGCRLDVMQEANQEGAVVTRQISELQLRQVARLESHMRTRPIGQGAPDGRLGHIETVDRSKILRQYGVGESAVAAA